MWLKYWDAQFSLIKYHCLEPSNAAVHLLIDEGWLYFNATFDEYDLNALCYSNEVCCYGHWSQFSEVLDTSEVHQNVCL